MNLGANSLFTDALTQIEGKSASIIDFQYLSGGCIHQVAKVTTKQQDYCLKWNFASSITMFEKEVLGLELLRKSSDLFIPEVLGVFQNDEKSGLIMEFIPPSSKKTSFWEHLGTGLASLHRTTQSYYGLDHSNFIGSLPQSNVTHNDWITFIVNERLSIQLDLVLSKGLVNTSLLRDFEKLYKKLPDLLPCEKPALLHGDLWNGNILCGLNSTPYLIDPAVYFGNREMELAFIKLFGGFDDSFFTAYHTQFPLLSQHEERVAFYQLYPLLVHLNLFGRSYLPAIKESLNQYI